MQSSIQFAEYVALFATGVMTPIARRAWNALSQDERNNFVGMMEIMIAEEDEDEDTDSEEEYTVCEHALYKQDVLDSAKWADLSEEKKAEYVAKRDAINKRARVGA